MSSAPSRSRSLEKLSKHTSNRLSSTKHSVDNVEADQSRKSKNKKSKKKKRSRKNSGSSSDEEELRLLQRLEAERIRLKEERRKQKDLLKAKETPEEKRARRLREKADKERRRRERMGWEGEYQCYTDQDNPFGDSGLTNTFVWGKKLARDGIQTVSREQLETLNRQKQLENKIELEKVKRRRLEREAERAAHEAATAAGVRAREAQHYHCWELQEDSFHLQQARLRSQIRIRDGRAKPIDLLASYVSSQDGVDALDMHEPYTYLNGLGARDLEDLLEDIRVYKELEKNENGEYWDDVTRIVADELDKLRRLSSTRRDTVHQAVADDVTEIFKGKNGAQLEALQVEIEKKITGRRDGVDVGYWESLLSQLRAHISRARLRDRHRDTLHRKLELLRREQREKHETPVATTSCEAPVVSSPSPARPESYAAQYSPRPLSAHELPPDAVIIEPHEDERRLEFLRRQLPSTIRQEEPTDAMERVAREGMSAEEASFAVEQALDLPRALWADKYRPRKPRYFNRVHTGFEWNKYNQTHYDMDNPPPKIVQGYKFNIFYPDLIHKDSTPSFTLKPCADNAEFAVLRFHAGPPYEDIAFKIVNREWEFSYKRGFRCHFHNNIFQLWFHFKRYRYRR